MNCAICGCSDLHACVDIGTQATCRWVAPELCSFCLFVPIGVQPPPTFERLPLYRGIELR